MTTARAQRRRDEQLDHERALVAMRDAVIAAVGGSRGRQHRFGSAAIEDAVDEALAQMVRRDAHHGDLEHAKATWIGWAQRRLIDDGRSAETRHRAPVAIDTTTDAVGPGIVDVDVSELSVDAWQIRELFSVLRGDQLLWAEAYYDAIAAGKGPHPRGLYKVLGWSQSKTNKTAHRAQAKMVAFAERRASGAVCEEKRALLDAFIAATGGRRRTAAPLTDLGHDGFEQLLFHMAGCADCQVAFRARRRALASRGAILTFPLDALAGAWHILGEKLAGAAARLGLGGGAAATGGTAAATIGAKTTATVCVGVLCAAGATGELAGVLPPLLPADHPPPKTIKAAQTPRPAPASPTTRIARAAVQRVTQPPAPPPPPPPAAKRHRRAAAAATSSPTSTSRSSAAATTTRSSSRATPGDLPPAASTPPPPPPPAAPSSGSAAGTPASGTRCVPGSLGC